MHLRNIDGMESLTITYNTLQYGEHVPVHYTITNDTSITTAARQSTTDFERKDTNSLTCNTEMCNDTLGYIASDQIVMVLVMVIFAGYNTHWLTMCINGEQSKLPIDGKHTTARYSWNIMVVRVMKGSTSTSICNGNTWYISIVNHVTTNKHTDGIVIGRIRLAHENQVSRSNLIHDNTHAERDTAQLIVEFEDVSICIISPTRWDGRGVSTDRLHPNTHPIWMN